MSDSAVYLQQRVNLRTLVDLRWVAIAGQGATLIIVFFAVGFQWALVAGVGILLISFLATWHQDWSRVRDLRQYMVGDDEAARFLAVDILQILVLLGLTGGIVNPFCVLILGPVTVSASVLSRKSTLGLSILAVAGITLITYVRLPLPWASAPITLPIYYTSAIWVSLVFGAVFMTLYIFSIAEAVRRMNRAVTEAERALAHEQRLSAMGGLAAAAAHELGTPLATIAVVAKEMVNDLSADSRLREDAQLLLDESARCRGILTDLARDPKEDRGAPYRSMPIETLVRLAAEPFLRKNITFDVLAEPEGLLAEDQTQQLSDLEFEQPQMPRDPELIKGLGNLLHNALDFANSEVLVECRWTRAQITISIIDDGPGIDPGIERRLGEPYIHGEGRSHFTEKSDGSVRSSMGLGVFIAKSLLSHSNASVTFARNSSLNHPEHDFRVGTTVEVVWDRSKLDL